MMLVSIDPHASRSRGRVRVRPRAPAGAGRRASRAKICCASFDLLAKAEQDVRAASQPRYAPRDGAAEVDPSAQARAARGSDRRLEKGGAPVGAAPARRPRQPRRPAHRSGDLRRAARVRRTARAVAAVARPATSPAGQRRHRQPHLRWPRPCPPRGAAGSIDGPASGRLQGPVPGRVAAAKQDVLRHCTSRRPRRSNRG